MAEAVHHSTNWEHSVLGQVMYVVLRWRLWSLWEGRSARDFFVLWQHEDSYKVP
jgi:hypothetical protein